MPILIKQPIVVAATGNKPKEIREYVGRVNTKTGDLSIARMKSPGGWVEPGQKPEFNEYTLVIRGMLRVKTEGGFIDVHEGEAVIVQGGGWVQYSTPEPDGAEYVAVCLPAFSPETVHRDESGQLKDSQLIQKLSRISCYAPSHTAVLLLCGGASSQQGILRQQWIPLLYCRECSGLQRHTLLKLQNHYASSLLSVSSSFSNRLILRQDV